MGGIVPWTLGLVATLSASGQFPTEPEEVAENIEFFVLPNVLNQNGDPVRCLM